MPKMLKYHWIANIIVPEHNNLNQFLAKIRLQINKKLIIKRFH